LSAAADAANQQQYHLIIDDQDVWLARFTGTADGSA
jgi:hypothetical protein